MSWCKVAILCLALTLSACGFEPMLATQSTSQQALLPAMDISNIPDREGQYLRNLLIDRLYTQGRPENAAYQLNVSPLVKEIVSLGIQKDATATRAQMQISTELQLIEKGTNKAVLTRTLKAVGAYNLLDNQLATLVSQKNITESVLQELGNDMVTELNLYFRRKDENPS